MEKWEEYNFNEITCNFDKHRIPLSAKERASRKGMYRYFGAQGVIGYIDDYLFDGKYILLAEDGENLKSRKQSLAQLVEGKFWVNNHAHIFTGNEKCNIDFLYYLFNFIDFTPYITGSAQPKLSQQSLSKINIKLPPLPTQQKIAAILSSLDDKIELNNKINANLEQQAQALFKNWFVDFEPFSAEETIESPIGTMIPCSLQMVKVADIPHLLETGKRPKGGAVAEGVPSIGAENVKQLGAFDYSSNKYIPREYADSLGKGKINGYELLLYKDGGKPGTFIPHFSMFGEGFPYDECYINEHVFKLDFYDKGLNEFAYFYFNTEYVKNWLANNGGKAAIPGINQNDVNAIWIYDLENHKVKEFAKFVEPLFKKIFSNCKQNRKLSTIRDTLLPKLMNGEIETNSIIINKR